MAVDALTFNIGRQFDFSGRFEKLQCFILSKELPGLEIFS